MNYGEIAGIGSRPVAVMVIGAVFLVAGIASIVFGALMLTDVLDQFLNDILQKYPELDPVLKYGAVIFVTGGLINTIAGAGFFLGWKGSYYVSVIMLIASMAASVAFIFLSNVTISDTILISTAVVIVVFLMMLICMFRYSTKSYFLVLSEFQWIGFNKRFKKG